MLRSLSLVGIVSLAACSGPPAMTPPDLASAETPPDLAGSAADMTLPSRAPNDHPPLPSLSNMGGVVLKNIDLVTIVWPGDEALGEEAFQFHQWMVQSQYWTQSLAEYGVQAGTATSLVVLPTAAPSTIDDNQFHTLIKQWIAATILPPPNANTLYQFIVPAKTKSTLQGTNGCQDYGGYHAETQTANNSGIYVSYSVNLQCQGFGAGSAFDMLTDVLSHEAAEAATDPHPFTMPTWTAYDIPSFSEVGDLCVGLDATFHTSVDGGPDAGTVEKTYVVTRLWSQVAASAGTSDPCVPAPATPYFNVGVNPESLTLTRDANGNGSVTAEIEPYAFGDVGTIKWAFEGGFGPGITVTPDQGEAKAGDTILLTVTADSTAQAGPYPVLIFDQAQKGGSNQWVSLLTIQ